MNNQRPSNTDMNLKGLRKALEENNKGRLFHCIKDLVTNGLSLERFPEGERTPSRQDLTQFLAAWFKYIGISADECRDWMNRYCVDVLSSISSSSPSKIRHSTKSNIKYIYKSDTTLDCRCENNPFKTDCDRNCPVYEEMLGKYREAKAREANISYEIEGRNKVEDEEKEPSAPSVREQYRDQFEEAVKTAHECATRGVPHRKIVAFLNDRGFKTRSGKKWTYSLLGNELRAFRARMFNETSDNQQE